MHTNFDFLLKDPQFEPFAEAAVSAERVLSISPALCATACRTALEFAVKWVYSVDGSLTKPYEEKLVTLISNEDFKDLIPAGMIAKLDYLRRVGNNATHNPKGVSRDQAVLALQPAQLSGLRRLLLRPTMETTFVRYWRKTGAAPVPVIRPSPKWISRRAGRKLPKAGLPPSAPAQIGYTVKPMDMTEAVTRKAYIDVMLQDAAEKWLNWVDG